MELKFWVPGPALPLMLYDFEPCALCRLKGRLFVTLVTLSLAMGYSWPIQGLALASLGEKILTSDEPYELEHRSFGPKMELFLFFRPHGVSFLGGASLSLPPLTPNQPDLLLRSLKELH